MIETIMGIMSMFSVHCTNNSRIHLQRLWSELWQDGLEIKANKKKFLVVHKNSDNKKKNRNTKLTFLYNYSSDHTEKTEAKSHSEGAVKLLAAIWIHLYRTIINSAFYKSGPHSRRAKRKALMEDMSGAKYSVVWLNLYWTFQQCYKALCLTKPTQSQLWNVVAASCSEETTNWAQKVKFLRKAR